jgi:UbiD family decarboxylase
MADCPALLFDIIKGHASGFRVLTNATTSPQRAALALGIATNLRPLDALRDWMARRHTLASQKPIEIGTAAWLENSTRGDDVDVTTFPAPDWHKQDGGPYIGSGKGFFRGRRVG